MKKKYLLLLIVLPSLLFLGCSHESLRAQADGGVFRSDDGGKTFRPVNKIDEENSIASVDILDIAISNQNPDVLYVGTPGRGLFKSENGGEVWQQLFSGSTVWNIAINPINNDILYIAVTTAKRGKIFKSTDAGGNWEEVYTESQFGIDITALEIDPNNPSRIYAGDSQGVLFRSSDGGERWRILDKQTVPVSIIKISSADPRRLYYSAASTLSTSGDDGATFERLNIRPLGRNALVNSLEIDPGDANTIYASSDQIILKSTDAGKNFSSVNILNPRGPSINGLVINPRNTNVWSYGSGYAFYQTADNGVNWTVTQLSSSRIIKLIRLNPANSDIIYLGMGRSVRK